MVQWFKTCQYLNRALSCCVIHYLNVRPLYKFTETSETVVGHTCGIKYLKAGS